MNDFESAVTEAHNALVEAGHGWAQPRRLTEVEKLEAARLPVEWISVPAPKPDIERRTVRIRRLDVLAVRFASLSMMTRVTKPRSIQLSELASDQA